MNLKKNLIDKFNQQNNVTEPYDESLQHNILEDSSTDDKEIPRVKNILKMPTPLP